MVCNIIVRAMHDLYVAQGKSVEEIVTYLDTDCQNLDNEETVGKVSEFFPLTTMYAGLAKVSLSDCLFF